MPRSEVAALGAIVAALAIVALAQQGLPTQQGVAQPAQPAPARAVPAPEALAALRDGRAIELNCADAATLELLPGVGPALARRIVEHRAASGRFVSVDALDAVRGVGPKTLDAVRPLLSVGASTCPASKTPTR